MPQIFFNCVVFADDANVFCAGKNLQQFLEVVHGELEKLKFWFDVNKISVNLFKKSNM